MRAALGWAIFAFIGITLGVIYLAALALLLPTAP